MTEDGSRPDPKMFCGEHPLATSFASRHQEGYLECHIQRRGASVERILHLQNCWRCPARVQGDLATHLNTTRPFDHFLVSQNYREGGEMRQNSNTQQFEESSKQTDARRRLIYTDRCATRQTQLHKIAAYNDKSTIFRSNRHKFILRKSW